MIRRFVTRHHNSLRFQECHHIRHVSLEKLLRDIEVLAQAVTRIRLHTRRVGRDERGLLVRGQVEHVQQRAVVQDRLQRRLVGVFGDDDDADDLVGAVIEILEIEYAHQLGRDVLNVPLWSDPCETPYAEEIVHQRDVVHASLLPFLGDHNSLHPVCGRFGDPLGVARLHRVRHFAHGLSRHSRGVRGAQRALWRRVEGWHFDGSRGGISYVCCFLSSICIRSECWLCVHSSLTHLHTPPSLTHLHTPPPRTSLPPRAHYQRRIIREVEIGGGGRVGAALARDGSQRGRHHAVLREQATVLLKQHLRELKPGRGDYISSPHTPRTLIVHVTELRVVRVQRVLVLGEHSVDRLALLPRHHHDRIDAQHILLARVQKHLAVLSRVRRLLRVTTHTRSHQHAQRHNATVLVQRHHHARGHRGARRHTSGRASGRSTAARGSPCWSASTSR